MDRESYRMRLRKAQEDYERKRLEPSPNPMRRREQRALFRAAFIIAPAVLLYGLITRDFPVVFLAAALITFFLRPVARHFLGKEGEFVAGVLQGLSLSLFAGAIFLLFF